MALPQSGPHAGHGQDGGAGSLALPPWYPEQLDRGAVPRAGEVNTAHVLRVAGTVLAKRICSKHIAFVTILGHARVGAGASACPRHDATRDACDGALAAAGQAPAAHTSGGGNATGECNVSDATGECNVLTSDASGGPEPAPPTAVQLVLRSTEFAGQTRPLAKSLRVGAVVSVGELRA